MIDKAKRVVVFDKCGGRCAYCGCKLSHRSMQVDHLLAKHRNGGDDPENLMPCCRSCNNYKASFTIEQFRRNLYEAVDAQRRRNSMFRLLERFKIIEQVKTKVVFYFEERRGR